MIFYIPCPQFHQQLQVVVLQLKLLELASIHKQTPLQIQQET